MANRGTYIPFPFIKIIRHTCQKLIKVVMFPAPLSDPEFAIHKAQFNLTADFQPNLICQFIGNADGKAVPPFLNRGTYSGSCFYIVDTSYRNSVQHRNMSSIVSQLKD